MRDINERQRDISGIFKQYTKFVKPALEKFVRPQAKVADVVVPRGVENLKAIDMISQDISVALKLKSEAHLRSLKKLKLESCTLSISPKSHVTLLPQMPQLLRMLTVIRDKNTDREDFIFGMKRMARLLIESALNQVPYSTKIIKTPTGSSYHGLAQDCKICAVSILRGGQPLESAFGEMFVDPVIGKMLIQSDSTTGEPSLHSLHLPHDIKNRQVFLLDAQISTAFTALMAIRVLLDHGVNPKNLFFLTVLAASEGLQTVENIYPDVRIYTAAIDQSDKGLSRILIPGAGNIGYRWNGA